MTNEEILKKAKEALDVAIRKKYADQNEADRKAIVSSIGKDLAEGVQPLFYLMLEEMAKQGNMNQATLQTMFENIKLEVPKAEVSVTIPPIDIPKAEVTVKTDPINTKGIEDAISKGMTAIKITPPPVNVNFDASRIQVPTIKMPDEMNVSGWVNFMGYDRGLLENPLPVQIRDARGNAVDIANLLKNLSLGQTVLGGSSGKADFFTIKDIRASSISVIDQDVGAVRVVGNLTASLASSTVVTLINNDGLAYNSDNPLPITGTFSSSPAPQVSGYADSVNVMQYGGVNTPTGKNETTDGVFRTIIMTDSVSSVNVVTTVGLTDTQLRASTLDVKQVSGSIDSVSVTNTVTVTATDLDVRDLVNATDSVSAYQVSGANWSVNVTNTVPVSATDLDIRDLVNATDSVSAYQVSGHAWSVFVKEIFGSTATDVVNPDGRLKVELPSGSSGLTDTELRASSVPVAQASGAVWSTQANLHALDSTGAWEQVRNNDGVASGALRVVHATDVVVSTNVVSTVGLTDTQLRASTLDIKQVSGSSDSVNVLNTVTIQATDLDIRDLVNATDSISAYQVSGANWSVNVTNTVPVSATDLDIRDLVNATDSISAYQVSGHAWSVFVKEIFGSTATDVVNPDGRLKVELPSGASGLTDTELRASSVPVAQASGANWSVSVTNTVPVSATDLDIRDLVNATDSVSVYQVSGAIWSVNAFQGTSPWVVSATDLDIRDLTNVTDSVSAYQVSGATWSVFATNPVDNGDAATALRVVVAGNSSASVSATQSGTWNITTVTNITNSVAASIVDSSGVQYSGSNPVPVTLISGALTSTIAVGDTLARTADAGAAPIKVGGIARTTNPTAYADGDRSNFATDKLGRQLTRPIQVRDLTKTAYVSLSTGTEATLLAGVAGSYLDLVYIMGANNSDAAVVVDIRPVTAGNVVMSIAVPANGTAGIACPIPLPQSDTGNNWTVDMPDITGTTVNLTALFTQEL